jgi:cyclopropane fatty-acyl-phospholipid synthase-like methyltransferase
MADAAAIKKFWDKRADKFQESCIAALGETKLRKLEIKTILKYLKGNMNILDVGCGNGYSTIEFARNIQSEFFGIDYSKKNDSPCQRSFKQGKRSEREGKI